MSNQSFIDKLATRQANRKGGENAFLNLFNNFYNERRFIHVLITQNLSNGWTSTIISHYIVFLVICWETFFRDVFVFLLKQHPSLKNELQRNARVRKAMGRTKASTLDVDEYIADMFNFQNLESLQDAFAPALGIHNGLELPTEQLTFMNVREKGWLPFDFSSLFPTWNADLDFILQERHRIIHDANHRCTVSSSDIQRIECVLFYYLQLFGIFASDRFQLPWIKFNVKVSYLEVVTISNEYYKNILISFNDLLSDDWEVME